MISPLPHSTTLSEYQLAWWEGFVHGLTGIRPHAVWKSDQAQPMVVPNAETSAVATPMPWHDPGLPIVERMELADGKSMEHQLMAAMGQLDCGSCGYLCQTYSAAIAAGQESDLTLCAPGGQETKRMLNQLVRKSGIQPSKTGTTKSADDTGWTRKNPFRARLIQSRPLNESGSAKDTRHIAIDLSGSGIRYNVGDTLGVYPTNCPELVATVIRLLKMEPTHEVATSNGESKSLGRALLEDFCLRDPSDELLDRCGIVQPTEGIDVLEALTTGRQDAMSAQEFVELLETLKPRLYSIASSMKMVGNQVHLTVGKVTYRRGDRVHKGVASTMLAERLRPGEYVRVFVQPNHNGFTVPQDPTDAMIMIGPGTGIAPFIAFLQERAATAAPGRNWLFFGNPHQATDYLYRQQLCQFRDQSVLTRIDTAFSRDGDAKVYVQDRMRASARQLWQWMQAGSYIFVCGDAARMARDVHQALIEIVMTEGKMSSEQASAYVANLADRRRYVRDIY